ncbi:hypothetical protein [Amycolatopsis nigrescens]|uniref:hypothetical protein n=1 Tax=Amycolatopsis nigrescens TaxID=381445 RepID=UPI000373704E|nr:hypothetical protein [Amycolatopsis nigrescens]
MAQPEQDDEPSRQDFLESTASFLSKLSNGLRNLTSTPDTPEPCRQAVEEALGLLALAGYHVGEAARFAERCELSLSSESDEPCLGPVDALILHANPESFSGTCVLHAAFGLHFLEGVHVTGDTELMAEAQKMALELAHLLATDEHPS